MSQPEIIKPDFPGCSLSGICSGGDFGSEGLRFSVNSPGEIRLTVSYKSPDLIVKKKYILLKKPKCGFVQKFKYSLLLIFFLNHKMFQCL